MITYILPAILFSYFSILISIIYLSKNFKICLSQKIGFIGILLSISLILTIVFFPFPIDANKISFMISNNLDQKNNIIPFKSIINYIKTAINGELGQLAYQLFGNIILFIPFGFTISLYFLEHKKTLIKVFAFSVIFSLSVEIVQFIFGSLMNYNYRSCDIDDIILNVLGGVIGFGLFNSYFRNSSKKDDIRFQEVAPIT